MSLAILAGLLLATQSPAAPPPSSTAAPVTAEKPAKRVCKSTPVPGSRVQKNRVCRTKAEWEEQAKQARLQTERQIDESGGRIPAPPPS